MQLSAAFFGFALACLLSLGLTPLVRRAAMRRCLRDRGGEPHKRHVASRPHVGGLALLAAVVLTLLALTLLFPALPPEFSPLLSGLIGGGALIAVLGLIDDMQGSRPWKKLATQAVAVALLQLQVDVLGWSTLSAHGTAFVLLGCAISVPWFLGLTNAMNLIDGLDGLASGITVSSGVGLIALGWVSGQPALAVVAAVVVGACLGFLRSNAHPAKIFMGDTGSMFLGFTLAALGARLFWSRPDPACLAALLLIVWVPLLDTLYAIVRRWARNESIFRPDQGHVHHRLLDLGFSHRQAGLLLCGLSALGAVAGVQVGRGDHTLAWAGSVLVATLPLAWMLTVRPARLRVNTASPHVDGTTAGAGRVVSHNRAA